MMISEVTVNNRLNPVGIDCLTPRVSWVFAPSETVGEAQTAYEIIVATDENAIVQNLGNFHSTGRVAGADNINVPLGVPLKTRTRYFVRVRAWGLDGLPTEFSDTFFFETGNRGQFSGEWITDNRLPIARDEDFYKHRPSPVFVKGFRASKGVAKARLYISGLGFYEARINGKNVTPSVLNPPLSNYSKTVYYSTFDVTSLICGGENTIEVEVGNGMYNPLPLKVFGKYNLRDKFAVGVPKVILDLEVTYQDASKEYVKTDTTWGWYESGLLFNNIYIGEVYDSRHKGGFPEAHPLKEVRPVDMRGEGLGSLRANEMELIHITKVIDVPAASITQRASGEYIVDYGQNFNGMIRICLKDDAGEHVTMEYGETLNSKGEVDCSSTIAGSVNGNGGKDAPTLPTQKDTIIANGTMVEYSQKFTFHSGRYVSIKGSKNLVIDKVQGLRINTDLTEIGEVHTSSEMLNTLYSVATWTKLSSIYSIQADTPRERFCYGGDIVCTSNALSYQYNTYNFYAKIINDFAQEQDINGGITETAPYMGIRTGGLGGTSGPLGWQLVFPYLHKMLLKHYGDTGLIEKSYPRLKKQVEFLETIDYEYVRNRGLGDWCAVAVAGKDPKEASKKDFIEMVHYYLHFKYFTQFAELLRKEDDLAKYTKVCQSIRKYIQDNFQNKDKTFYDASQTSNALALYAGLSNAEETVEALLHSIVNRNNGHLDGGIFGTKAVYSVLARHNKNDAIYNYLNKDTYPSFGFMLKKGATTIWERMEESSGDAHGVEAQNHSMFTSFTEWYYQGLGGISANYNAVGFDNITITPFIHNALNHVYCKVNTVRGLVQANWKRSTENKELINLSITIPIGAKATLVVPKGYQAAGNNDTLLQSGTHQITLKQL